MVASAGGVEASGAEELQVGMAVALGEEELQVGVVVVQGVRVAVVAEAMDSEATARQPAGP